MKADFQIVCLRIKRTSTFIEPISSLELQEFAEMVKSIRTIEKSLGSAEKRVQDCEKPCFEKLGKSIVATNHMPVGHILGWAYSMISWNSALIEFTILLVELITRLTLSAPQCNLDEGGHHCKGLASSRGECETLRLLHRKSNFPRDP